MTEAHAAFTRTRPAAKATTPWSVPTLAVALFATGFGLPRAGGYTLADVLIGAFVVLATLEMVARRARPRPIVIAVLLPILLVLGGALIGALDVGLTHWIVYDLIRDIGAAAALLAVLQVFDLAPAKWFRIPARALAAVVAIVALQLVFLGQETLRAKATFPNPNVAGHFMATCFMAMLVLPVPRWVRVAGLGAAGVGVVATGSFGAILQVAVGLTVVAVGAARRIRPATRQLLVFAVVATIGFLGVAAASGVQFLPERGESTGYNANHLERTTSGRLDLWGAAIDQVIDRPWGIGPGSSRNLQVLREGDDSKETHSEPLAFLSERGAIGLLGLVALWATLWRFAVPRGVGRAMILSLVVASFFRETSHYRHLWILLALVVTYERTMAAARARRSLTIVP
ncbi:MAG TPA: O-antigen ligase family protein [Acidimicrobiales bacterium]